MYIGDIFQPSFNQPSFDMLCKQLKDHSTVKLAIFFRLLASEALDTTIWLVTSEIKTRHNYVFISGVFG